MVWLGNCECRDQDFRTVVLEGATENEQDEEIKEGDEAKYVRITEALTKVPDNAYIPLCDLIFVGTDRKCLVQADYKLDDINRVIQYNTSWAPQKHIPKFPFPSDKYKRNLINALIVNRTKSTLGLTECVPTVVFKPKSDLTHFSEHEKTQIAAFWIATKASAGPSPSSRTPPSSEKPAPAAKVSATQTNTPVPVANAVRTPPTFATHATQDGKKTVRMLVVYSKDCSHILSGEKVETVKADMEKWPSKQPRKVGEETNLDFFLHSGLCDKIGKPMTAVPVVYRNMSSGDPVLAQVAVGIGIQRTLASKVTVQLHFASEENFLDCLKRNSSILAKHLSETIDIMFVPSLKRHFKDVGLSGSIRSVMGLDLLQFLGYQLEMQYNVKVYPPVFVIAKTLTTHIQKDMIPPKYQLPFVSVNLASASTWEDVFKDAMTSLEGKMNGDWMELYAHLLAGKVSAQLLPSASRNSLTVTMEVKVRNGTRSLSVTYPNGTSVPDVDIFKENIGQCDNLIFQPNWDKVGKQADKVPETKIYGMYKLGRSGPTINVFFAKRKGCTGTSIDPHKEPSLLQDVAEHLSNKYWESVASIPICMTTMRIKKHTYITDLQVCNHNDIDVDENSLGNDSETTTAASTTTTHLTSPPAAKKLKVEDTGNVEIWKTYSTEVANSLLKPIVQVGFITYNSIETTTATSG